MRYLPTKSISSVEFFGRRARNRFISVHFLALPSSHLSLLPPLVEAKSRQRRYLNYFECPKHLKHLRWTGIHISQFLGSCFERRKNLNRIMASAMCRIVEIGLMSNVADTLLFSFMYVAERVLQRRQVFEGVVCV